MYLNRQLGTGLGRGGGFERQWGCWGEPIANICWLAGGGEMDCSGTVSERQFHHHLYSPVRQVFLEDWGDLLVKGKRGGGKGLTSSRLHQASLTESV